LLGDEQPFYGLQAPPPAEMGDQATSIADMAAEYIEALRSIQPQGPYLIGGQSFGGLVAFEMAQQLLARGEEVGLLALLDTWSPVIFERLPRENDDALLLSVIAGTLAREKGKHLLLSPEQLRQMDADEQLNYFLEQIRQADLLGRDIPADVGASYVRRFLAGYRARLRAARDYQPMPYAGVITLMRASEQDPQSVKDLAESGIDINEPTYGWRELTSATVDVRYVPGSHETMNQQPHVRSLADQLSRCLGIKMSAGRP